MTGDLGPAPATADWDVYARLIADLDASGSRYRLIEHAPEGRTEPNEPAGGSDALARPPTGGTRPRLRLRWS